MTVVLILSGLDVLAEVENERIDARICVMGAVDVTDVMAPGVFVGLRVAAPMVYQSPAVDGSILPWRKIDGFVLAPDVPVDARYMSSPNVVYARPRVTAVPVPVVSCADSNVSP